MNRVKHAFALDTEASELPRLAIERCACGAVRRNERVAVTRPTLGHRYRASYQRGDGLWRAAIPKCTRTVVPKLPVRKPGDRHHKWIKGSQCARCSLLRRERQRASAQPTLPGPVVCIEYSRDGAAWVELRRTPACEARA